MQVYGTHAHIRDIYSFCVRCFITKHLMGTFNDVSRKGLKLDEDPEEASLSKICSKSCGGSTFSKSRI